MKQQLKNALKSSQSDTGILHLAASIRHINLPEWLYAQPAETKIYFRSRNADLESAATGIAKIYNDQNSTLPEALASIDSITDKDENLRFFGGTCFDPARTSDPAWQPFGKFTFILPQIELHHTNGIINLSCNITRNENDTASTLQKKLNTILDTLDFSDSAPPHEKSLAETKITEQTHLPDKNQWCENVNKVIADIKAGRCEKIVLCRNITLDLSNPIDPMLLLSAVHSPKHPTYNFCFQYDKQTALLGVTPECLFKKTDRTIFTEAVAGTAPTDPDPHKQNLYTQALINSAKERREHGYVFDNIDSALKKIASETKVLSRRQIIPLEYVQHITSTFQATLNDNTTIADILNALHPTAAVNGTPSDIATQIIKYLEPFDRGWYTGPVGWISKNNAEFAVAIRSALINENSINLYAGAGIVEESNPKNEWLETQNKLKPFLTPLAGI